MEIGDIYTHRHYAGWTAEILDFTNRGYKIMERNANSRRKKEREGKIQYISKGMFEYNYQKAV